MAVSTFHSGRRSRSRLRCSHASTFPWSDVEKRTAAALFDSRSQLISRDAERPNELLTQTGVPSRHAQRTAVELPKQGSGFTDRAVPVEIPGLSQLPKFTPVSGMGASVLGIVTTHDACCTV